MAIQLCTDTGHSLWCLFFVSYVVEGPKKRSQQTVISLPVVRIQSVWTRYILFINMNDEDVRMNDIVEWTRIEEAIILYRKN